MKLEVNACDLGLSEKYGKCAVDTAAAPISEQTLSGPQRLARGVVGLGFVGIAGLLARPRPLRPLSAVGLWLGVTHVVAAATGYAGCPELGAIPSLLLRRPVATWCGPWDWADRHLPGSRPARAAAEPQSPASGTERA